jgi:glycosyltransferase involved in cell wall biosynthesis
MIDTKKYNIINKKFLEPYNILICSNMIKEKGIFELLDAVPIVIEKLKNSKFVFIGDGKDLKKLKEKTKKMGIEENIVFTGYINGLEKINFFKKAHIFVLPSYSEGFPTVALEAMASGLPLIITPVGGIADFVKDLKHGFLLKTMPPSSKEIAEKIIKLLENPNLVNKISDFNIIESKEKYDVKLVSQKIVNIYDNL